MSKEIVDCIFGLTKTYPDLKFESIHESPEGQIFIINFKENELEEDDLKVGEFFLHEGEKYEIIKRERFKKLFGDLPGDNIGLLVKKIIKQKEE